jgi:hypothetical protein
MLLIMAYELAESCSILASESYICNLLRGGLA